MDDNSNGTVLRWERLGIFAVR